MLFRYTLRCGHYKTVNSSPLHSLSITYPGPSVVLSLYAYRSVCARTRSRIRVPCHCGTLTSPGRAGRTPACAAGERDVVRTPPYCSGSGRRFFARKCDKRPGEKGQIVSLSPAVHRKFVTGFCFPDRGWRRESAFLLRTN